MTSSQKTEAIKHFSTITPSDMSGYEIIGIIKDLAPYLVNGDIDESTMVGKYQQFLRPANINPRPDEESFMDKSSAVLIRYKYQGPQDSRNRDFCAYMMSMFSTDYFRKEDINQMSFSTVNNAFGTYSIWDYKGSYNCRHAWVAYVFRLKKGEDVSDAENVRRSSKDSSKKNLKPGQ